MNKLTTEHILSLIEELPTDIPFDYVSGGDSKAKLNFHKEEVSVCKIINYWNESLMNFSILVYMFTYTAGSVAPDYK